MALDAPIVTENLPNLAAGDPAPLPDAGDATLWYVRRSAQIIIDLVGELHRISWWEAWFCGIGMLAVGLLIYGSAAHLWARRRENRRLDRMAVDLANSAWLELSPSDLAEAEERWPHEFAFARYINERSPLRWPGIAIARQQQANDAKAVADAWFEQQREEARRA